MRSVEDLRGTKRYFAKAERVDGRNPAQAVDARRAALARHRKDWCLWGREVLGVPYFTEDQRRLVRTVQDNKRTLGQSGNGTGKTFISAFIARAFVSLYPSEVICTSSSQWQVRERLWAEFRKLTRTSHVPLGGVLNKTSYQATVNGVIQDKWAAHAVATNDGSNLQGGHMPSLLVVIDEAHAVDKDIWDAVEAMMQSPNAKTLGLFNPLDTSCYVHELVRRPDLWRVVNLSCMTHPNVVLGEEVVPGAVTRKWVEDMKRAWGEGSPMFQARVLGIFPTRSDDALVSLYDLELAADADGSLCADDGAFIGVDISRQGSDSNWAAVTVDRTVVHEDSWHEDNTMFTVGRILRLMDEFEVAPERVNIDDGGVGGGAVDRLKEQGYDVNPVNFGAGPVGDWEDEMPGLKFANRKAELHWAMRTLVKAKAFRIPRKFDRMWADLLAPRYKVRSDGKFLIESKADVKKRIRRSPDAGDAVVLSLARDRACSPSINFIE